MTFKLKTLLTKEEKAYNLASGNGTLKIVRTSKNSYKIPTIYSGDGVAWRINKNKFNIYDRTNLQPKKTSISGLKMVSAKKTPGFAKTAMKYNMMK